MNFSRVAIVVALVLVLGVPFALRPAASEGPRVGEAETLIVITPHVQQIRHEFEMAFDRWHLANHGTHVAVDWRTPGGTSEIIKQLEAQYIAATKDGKFDLSDPRNPRCPPGTIGVDVAFGGGSFDHTRLKNGVTVTLPGQKEPVKIPMSERAGFTQAQLDEWFGENKIGSQKLYEAEQYWLGTALSSFGIVYSRDVLKELGVHEPRSFEDLTDPRLFGWVALADPRQSGSVATTFEAILNGYGWDKGWRILRDMCANTRYFTNSSTKPPIDISAGEAAAGLAIDFYGRSQAQSLLRPGQKAEESRVGYIDPVTAVYIDADPASIMRGCPHPELARRFLEFCLSEEGQALWQFRAQEGGQAFATNPERSEGPATATTPEGPSLRSGLVANVPAGPVKYELRRMPVRRVMYQKYFERFVDKVNPFELAKDMPNRGWRPAIGIMMGAFSIDIADEQRAAWRVLCRARADPKFPPERLTEMDRVFYSWPRHEMADGTKLEFSEANFKAIARDTNNWRDPSRTAAAKRAYTAFFRRAYERVVELGNQGG